MLLRDLSSAITQQCSSKLQLYTPEDYLDDIRKNQVVEFPSVETAGSADIFSVYMEYIQVGCIKIYQHHASTSHTIGKRKDSENYFFIILPSIQGSSSLTSENDHYHINQRTGLIISNCNDKFELKIMKKSIHIMILVPIREVEITFSHLIGLHAKNPIKFSPIIEGRFSPWMQILSTAVYGSGISQHYESIKNSLEHLTISGLLLTYSNNYSDTFKTSGSISPPRTVRRAINFMEEHMNDPITISAVADHVGVGIRALQLSFRKYMGVSPGEWLCDRRLDRVHAMLVEEETTVTKAALTWGFNDLSDFSMRYQKRYGYLPSKTPHKR